MSDSDQPPRRLLLAAGDLSIALAAIGLAPTIIGGVAVSLIAQPRQTEDLDALIVFDTAEVDSLLGVLERHGFRPRFRGMADLARRARMITVRHERTATAVDIALGCMPFEDEVLQRSSRFEAAGVAIRLPTPEDLVILKAAANRPKDQEDIRTIARVYPDMDRWRIRFWVEQYGDVLENPDLWPEVEALLQQGAR